MAKQESFIKLRGKVGDLSFSKNRRRGYEVRKPGGADKQRIKNDPNFQRTRENMAEFGSAAAMAKLIRLQMNNLMYRFGDKTMGNRLTSVVHRIQKADASSPRGERVFLPENSGLLKGFEFNAGSSLSYMFGLELPIVYDRASGDVTLEIPAFNPQRSLTVLPGATHVLFTLAAAEQSLDPQNVPRPDVAESSYMPVVGDQLADTLQVTVTGNTNAVVYIMVGIDLYQEVNGQHYPLLNNPYNTMTIVDVILP